MTKKRFALYHTGTKDNVFGDCTLEEGNTYVKTYGAIVKGFKAPSDLEVGELTKKRYSLSGSKPTVYDIVRLE